MQTIGLLTMTWVRSLYLSSSLASRNLTVHSQTIQITQPPIQRVRQCTVYSPPAYSSIPHLHVSCHVFTDPIALAFLTLNSLL